MVNGGGLQCLRPLFAVNAPNPAWSIQCENGLYDIFHCDSIKRKAILHWIAMKYTISHMKMPHVWEFATFLFSIAAQTKMEHSIFSLQCLMCWQAWTKVNASTMFVMKMPSDRPGAPSNWEPSAWMSHMAYCKSAHKISKYVVYLPYNIVNKQWSKKKCKWCIHFDLTLTWK